MPSSTTSSKSATKTLSFDLDYSEVEMAIVTYLRGAHNLPLDEVHMVDVDVPLNASGKVYVDVVINTNGDA